MENDKVKYKTGFSKTTLINNEIKTCGLEQFWNAEFHSLFLFSRQGEVYKLIYEKKKTDCFLDVYKRQVSHTVEIMIYIVNSSCV